MMKVLGVAVLSLALMVLTRFLGHRVPAYTDALPALTSDPVQVAIPSQSKSISMNGHHYDLEFVADYEINGLVVSYHNAKSFWNISHAQWGDYLNSMDLCVVWGDNLTQSLAPFRFWSGNWTCYFQTQDSAAFRHFRPDQLANNHLLPADSYIAQAIEDAQIGDQIQIKGKLANYRIDGGQPRKTSLTRADRGGGACEIIYVTDFTVLSRANGLWMRASRIMWYVFLGSSLIFLWGILVPVFRSTPH